MKSNNCRGTEQVNTGSRSDAEKSRPFVLHHVHILGRGNTYYDITLQAGLIASIVTSAQYAPSDDNHSPAAVYSCSGSDDAPQEERWVAPMLTDLHNHPGWTDFMEEDMQRRTPEEKKQRILSCFRALTRKGIGYLRDAGGFPPAVRSNVLPDDNPALYPSVIPCAAMLTQQPLDTALSNNAPWVKIFATGGSGADPAHVLDPLLDEKTFAEDVRILHQAGKKVMVHTFGGASLDWCIRYHADSVEHGIYMTREQAEQLAQQQIGYTATVRIYELLADPANPLGVPGFIREHASHTLEPHQKAVAYARDAGVRIGFGTDYYCDPACENHILEELYALIGCGLTAEEAWKTGTENAALILGRKDTGAVREGCSADLVVLNQDPLYTKTAADLEDAIVSVIHSGLPVTV